MWRCITGAVMSHTTESIHARPEDSKLPKAVRMSFKIAYRVF